MLDIIAGQGAIAMWNHLRYAARLLVRDRALTAAVVLSLGLGIGLNTAVFSFVDAVLLKPFPYKEADHLAFLWATKSYEVRRGISGPDLEDWRGQNRVFEDVVPYIAGGELSLGASESSVVHAALVGPRLFSLLGVRTSYGRTFADSEDRSGAEKVAILSHRLWRGRFGSDPHVVGRTIQLDEGLYTIIGIMPPQFFFPDDDVDLWLPLPRSLPGLAERGAPMVQAVTRLKPGITVQQAQAEMDTITRRLALSYPATNRDIRAGVFPLYNVVVGKYRLALWTLLGAVGMLLLIACTNVANLLLARGVIREKEMAIRATFGANRRDLVFQMLIETMALALLSGAVGVLFGLWGTRVLRGVNLVDIPRANEAVLDYRVLAFALAVSVLTGLIFGLAPGWKASRPNLAESMKVGGSGSSRAGRSRVRDLLVVAEVACAMILVACASLLVNSFVRLTRVSWGFNPDRVLLLEVKLPQSMKRVPGAQIEFTEEALQRLRRLPGVDSAAMGYGVPVRWGTWQITFLEVNGQRLSSSDWTAGTWYVSPGYFRAMGIPILKGREFTQEDGSPGARAVVVSQALAGRLWPGKDPIGKRLDILEPSKEVLGALRRSPQLGLALGGNASDWVREGPSYEVVGEVGRVRMFGVEEHEEPLPLYVDYREQTGPGFPSEKFVVRTTGDPLPMAKPTRARVRSAEPQVVVSEITTMKEVVRGSIGGRGSSELLLLVSTAFGTLALLLSATGIYGVLSHWTAQRTHEIGVRLALGAAPADVIGTVVGRGMRLVIAGVLFGLAATLTTTKLLSSYLFHVSPTDPTTLAASSGLLLAVALGTCYLPARRAAKVDPIVALRSE